MALLVTRVLLQRYTTEQPTAPQKLVGQMEHISGAQKRAADPDLAGLAAHLMREVCSVNQGGSSSWMMRWASQEYCYTLNSGKGPQLNSLLRAALGS
jgi:hypothetical protein